MRRRWIGFGALLAAAALMSQSAQAAPAAYRAELIRTPYGVPHVIAADLGGIGYGAGYAAAEDNFCEFAERMLTVSGTRSRHLGPGENNANVLSDLYHRGLLQSGRLERLLTGSPKSLETPSQDARALARGFIEGINRYVRDTGAANLTDPRCRGAAWLPRGSPRSRPCRGRRSVRRCPKGRGATPTPWDARSPSPAWACCWAIRTIPGTA
jgi:acyl-homoserine-lactone acylase